MRILIKGGKVFDGEKFILTDVLTNGDTIEKICPDITDEADFVWNAERQIVSAGLVDAHVHISGGEYGINAEMATLPFGVTAAADAGVGPVRLTDELGIKTAVFAAVSIKSNKPELKEAMRTASEYGSRAVGLKIYFDKGVSEVENIEPLRKTVEAAEAHGFAVMVHSSNPPSTMGELLRTLRRGDILTHAYHGGTNNVSDDRYECIKEARARGVIIDAGLAGNVHTDFSVFRGAIECGAAPDIISSDITRYSAYKRGGRYGLTMCMSIARHLGMPEEDIFKAVTNSPAAALRRADAWGTLAEGRIADIAVIEYGDESFDLTDKAGNRIKSDTGYRCVLTVSNGEIVYRK